MKQESKRATFEDVGTAQDVILDFVDKCIDDNRTLTKDERKKFTRNLRLATLGMGTEYRFLMKGRKKTYDLKHVEHAAYWLAYRTKNPVDMDEEKIEIALFWRTLRDMLFLVFPHAIETSIKISKEQLEYLKGQSEATDYE